MPSLRIATVPYLNIEPFLLALRANAGSRLPVCVERVRPSELAACFHRGDVDLCMLSSSDLLRQRAMPLRGASICCRGPVASVVLASRSSISTWARRDISVGLDAASSTSNDLARVILERDFGTRAVGRIVRDPIAEISTGACDVAVVIGDAALRLPRELVALDLGEAWCDWTSLPFVFAAWARVPGSPWHAADLEDLLESAERDSDQFLDRAIRERQVPIAESLARSYFERNIAYRFGVEERAGLDRFARHAGLPTVARPGRGLDSIPTAGITRHAVAGGER